MRDAQPPWGSHEADGEIQELCIAKQYATPEYRQQFYRTNTDIGLTHSHQGVHTKNKAKPSTCEMANNALVLRSVGIE